MKLLLLGGTKFLGRHLVTAALDRGHELTLFNRGQSQPELFPGVEQLHGDRDGNLTALHGRRWDAAIDTSGYVPRLVHASAALLADAVEHYTFISSVSVYANFNVRGIDEQHPVAVLEDESVEGFSPESYGALKALCEQAAEAEMPGRVLKIRPGLIVGPYDFTDRFTYWPHRVARGGEVLAPDSPAVPAQFIDVRDLAEWIVRMVEAQRTGIYNAKGPDYALTLGRVLEVCREVSGSDARFTWASEEFLLEQNVEPYTEMPLWVPREEVGFASVKSDKATAAGLTYRPLSETVRATLAWDATRSPEWAWRAGLKPEREAQLLQEWHRRAALPEAGTSAP